MSTSPAQHLTTNQILNAVSRKDYPVLFANLQTAHLPQGKVLYELGQRIDYAFFVPAVPAADCFMEVGTCKFHDCIGKRKWYEEVIATPG
jgi:hypothetical protein